MNRIGNRTFSASPADEELRWGTKKSRTGRTNETAPGGDVEGEMPHIPPGVFPARRAGAYNVATSFGALGDRHVGTYKNLDLAIVALNVAKSRADWGSFEELRRSADFVTGNVPRRKTGLPPRINQSKKIPGAYGVTVLWGAHGQNRQNKYVGTYKDLNSAILAREEAKKNENCESFELLRSRADLAAGRCPRLNIREAKSGFKLKICKGRNNVTLTYKRESDAQIAGKYALQVKAENKSLTLQQIVAKVIEYRPPCNKKRKFNKVDEKNIDHTDAGMIGLNICKDQISTRCPSVLVDCNGNKSIRFKEKPFRRQVLIRDQKLTQEEGWVAYEAASKALIANPKISFEEVKLTARRAVNSFRSGA